MSSNSLRAKHRLSVPNMRQTVSLGRVRKLGLALAGLAVLTFLPHRGVAADVITPEIALKACALFERDAMSQEGRAAAAIVLDFTNKSPAVLVRISPDSVPWIGVKVKTHEEARTRLLAAFIVGNVRAQLLAHENRDHPYEGWLQVLRTYAQLKKRNPKLALPEVDELARKRDAGTLRAEAEKLEKSAPPAASGTRA